MGCHAGLNVSDSFPTTADTASRLRDWAQALAQNGAGVYVANTGYGYGDFDTIALSERLMTMFAHNLASDGSIGRKLVLAKQQYFASIASYDPYAEKALAEATFYGLPFYRIGTGPDPAPPPLLTPSPTTTPNVAAAPLSFSFTGANALVAHSTPRGKYWSAADGGVEYLKDRPIEPRVSQEVTAVGTQRAHGVLIDALQTHDIAGNVDPLIATPMIDLAAHEPESKVTDVTFPATFATLNHWTAFGQNHDQLVVVPGQTREGDTQRLVDSIDVRVLYSSSTDFTAPLFTQVGSVVNGTTATLFARTSDPAGIPLVGRTSRRERRIDEARPDVERVDDLVVEALEAPALIGLHDEVAIVRLEAFVEVDHAAHEARREDAHAAEVEKVDALGRALARRSPRTPCSCRDAGRRG